MGLQGSQTDFLKKTEGTARRILEKNRSGSLTEEISGGIPEQIIGKIIEEMHNKVRQTAKGCIDQFRKCRFDISRLNHLQLISETEPENMVYKKIVRLDQFFKKVTEL